MSVSANIRSAVLTLLAVSFSLNPAAAKRHDKGRNEKPEPKENQPAVLWRSPADIASYDLFYGPGGKEHAPRGTFTFVKEDLNGTSPKLDLRDKDGVKWKVKLGVEARPETAASRLIWTVGYCANEDYFLPVLRVEGLPRQLKRGQNLIAPDGTFHNVRLKRHLDGEKKIGTWHWRNNPFIGTREFNALRVMMALINNWDLKDENNSIYLEKGTQSSDGSHEIYMVSDVGASFGTTGRSRTRARSKGNLSSYRKSEFIASLTTGYVDFKVPTRPSLILFFSLPEFLSRLRLRWIGKHIPISDARWIAQILSQVSPEQIRDAFRAARYSPIEVQEFGEVVERRIDELKKL